MRTGMVWLSKWGRERLILFWGVALLLGLGAGWPGWWGHLLGNVGAVSLNQALATKDGVFFERTVTQLAVVVDGMPASSSKKHLTTLLATALQRHDQSNIAALYWRQLPAPVPYLHLWGDYYAANFSPAAAISWYQQAVVLSPDEAYNYYLLGRDQERADQLEAARESYLFAQALLPDTRIHQSDLLLQLTSVSVRLSPKPDWPEVIAQLDKAITLDDFGDNVFTASQTHYLRGEALRALSYDEAAAAAYAQAIILFPRHYMAYIQLGNWVLSDPMGDLSFAESLFGAAITLDEQRVPAYLGLGTVYEHNGRLNDARAVYEKLLAIQPDNPGASQRLQALQSLIPFDDTDAP